MCERSWWSPVRCRLAICGQPVVEIARYSIDIFGVWIECVKALLVNVCNGTAKSAESGSRDIRVSTGKRADCACLLACSSGKIPRLSLIISTHGIKL